MDIEFQRRLDRMVGGVICGLLSWVPGACREPTPQARPERILVILLTEMGSLVLARPMFERLRQRYPDASVFALVFEQNREVLDLLGVVPEQHVFTVRNTSMRDFVRDSMRALGLMRRNRIDTVIDCELFSRVSSIYSFLSGASMRAGFHRHTQEGLYRGDFINRPVLYNPYHHISHQFVALVEALDAEGFPRVKRPVEKALSLPMLQLKEGEVRAMAGRLSSDFPQLSGKTLVLVYPGGGLLPIRAWPLEYFFALVGGLTRKGYAAGIIGLRRDKEIAGRILAHCDNPHCIDLTGYTRTIRELISLFHLSPLLVTNDGGPGNLASLTPIRSIVLFGPETPVLYGPLGGRTEIFHAHLSCSPCLTAYNHRASPCDGNNVCLKSIHPDTVLKKALEILEISREPPFKSV